MSHFTGEETKAHENSGFLKVTSLVSVGITIRTQSYSSPEACPHCISDNEACHLERWAEGKSIGNNYRGRKGIIDEVPHCGLSLAGF